MTDICVVMGNGPSLKGFDFTRLRGVASLGMNAAYRYWDEINWYPTYYACLDDQMIESHHDEIYRLWQEGNIEQFFVHNAFFTHHPDCICAEGFHSLDQVLPHWYKQRGKALGWPDLSQHSAFNTQDTTKVTTGAFAARFVAFLGHEKIALMGIDLKYVEIIKEAEKTEGVGLVMRETPKENPNYFFDSYQQAGDKYNIPNPDIHDNKLHIQSFQLIPNDFAKFGQQTKIVNTNPKSLLEVEKVFPLEPIDDVLAPHKMAAIIVPTNRFEIKAILANFDIWAGQKYAPLLRGDRDNRTELVFMFNNDSGKQHEAEIRARFEATDMTRFFSGLSFEYLGLEDDLDKYERDYTKKVGDHGYKSGPNNQFFRTMYAAENLGHYVFQMETDCVPLRAGWLSALREQVGNEPDFWVLGSAYHGVEELSPAFKDHINGNAIYAVGDDGFQDFLKSFWEPRTHAMVKGQDKRLAYDCILEKVFTEQKDTDPAVAKVIDQHGEMFRFTEYMLNISGKRDLSDLAHDYETTLLADYKAAYILHNRTAQDRVATKTPRYFASKSRKSDPSMLRPETLPRMLVIDMTAMGNGTATGEVKSNLFKKWPADRLLQVASPTPDDLALVRTGADGSVSVNRCDADTIYTAIIGFKPDVILYRPLPERPNLHALALSVIEETDLPLVTWVMDDWPTRLYAEDKKTFHNFDPSFKALLKRSVLRLSICDAMSKAYTKRYGMAFQAFANGVDMSAWPTPKSHSGTSLVVRYAGGLAPDMNAASIQRVAKSVQELADQGQDIRFEINTQNWWVKQSGKLFDGLSATTLTSHKRSFADYTAWLAEADALVIAYNFDEASLRYVRYSMANKLPEYLGSGVPILVHGPKDVATIDYVMQHQTAQVVETPEIEPLIAAFTDLSDAAVRQNLADKGRALAQERHDLTTLASNLALAIQEICPTVSPANFGIYITASDETLNTQSLDVELARKAIDKGSTGFLTYPNPLEIVAASLQQGQDGTQALADWQSQATAHLTFFRQARKSIQIVEHSHAVPDSFQESLPQGLLFPLVENDPLYLALASLLLDKAPAAQRILAELRASGTVAVKDYAGIDIAAAVSHSQTRLKTGTNGRGLPVSSSVALLQEQVVQLQATAETYYQDAEQMRRKVAGNGAGNGPATGHLQAQVAALQHEVDELYRSNSWRITGPLRKISQTLGSLRKRK